MNLISWDPFREMESLLDRYNRSPARSAVASGLDWTPVVDIKEDKDAFMVKAELAGVDKDDVDITVHDGVLTIKGEKKYEKTSEDDKHHRSECFYGSFARSFALPNEVRTEEISADYKNGILNLKIPKAEESKPKKIEVKVK